MDKTKLSTCRICGDPVALDAQSCPHCGTPKPTKKTHSASRWVWGSVFFDTFIKVFGVYSILLVLFFLRLLAKAKNRQVGIFDYLKEGWAEFAQEDLAKHPWIEPHPWLAANPEVVVLFLIIIIPLWIYFLRLFVIFMQTRFKSESGA